MPQLPIYNSKARTSTAQPEVMMQGAAQPYEDASKVLATAQDVTMKYKSALDSMQETAAKAQVTELLAQIEIDAANDTDINGEAKQIQKLQNTTKDIISKIPDSGVKSKVAFELEHQNSLAAIKINSLYAKKKVFADNLNTESLLDNYSKIGNADADAAAEKLIQDKVAAGFYTTHQGSELLKSYRLGSVDYDIQSDPSSTQASPVLKELLKGEKGKYAKLTKEELAEKIKDAKINIWRNKNSQKVANEEANTQGALDMSSSLLNDTLTISNIRNLYENKVIDLSTANIFESVVNKEEIAEPDTKDIADAKYLIALSDGDKDSSLKILNDATKMYGKKDLSKQAYAFVLQEVNKKFARERKGLSGWDKTTQFFMNSLKGLSDFGNSIFPVNSAPEAINKMCNKLIERISAGEDPKEASKLIQREAVLEAHPAALTYPEKGRKVIDSNGVIKNITPEGDILDPEEEAESNGV